MSQIIKPRISSFAFLLLILLLSCSDFKNKKHHDPTQRQDSTSKHNDPCLSLADRSPDKDFNIIKSVPAFISPDDIKNKTHYQKLDKEFYDRYLSSSELVNDWLGESEHPPDLQTAHFFWGALDLNNNMCQIIIYEHFSYNGNEDKLILINLDESRKVISRHIIAGRITNPAVDIKYSCKIWRNRFHVFMTDKGIIDHKPGRRQYQKDSIVTRYKMAGQKIKITGRDSSRQVYWE